ncbi:MAG: hypothetical protein GXN97_00730 [Aquificae bacterium]|nr:hypothetical protein [Aquificota bacterium]
MEQPLEPYRRLGYLYEALFNLGVLNELQHRLGFKPAWLYSYSNHRLDEYFLDLYKGFNITPLFKSVTRRILGLYFLQGKTFASQLLTKLEEKFERSNLAVFFYYGKPFPIEDDKDFALERFSQKFGEEIKPILIEEKGSLIHTDWILHLTTADGKHVINIADISFLYAKDYFDFYKFLRDEFLFAHGIYSIAQKDASIVGQGYVFKPINLKSVGNFRKLIEKLFTLKVKNPQELNQILTLLQKKNRDVAKLLQACSYTYDYLSYLRQKGYLPLGEKPIYINIFGITLHKLAQLGFQIKNLSHWEDLISFLSKAKEVYSTQVNPQEDFQFFEQFTQRLEKFLVEIKPAAGIEIQTKKVKTFIPDQLVLIENWKISEEFRLNDQKRNLHKEVFKNVLDSHPKVANLSVPGIGKTTTLLEHKKDNSLIFYTSPRIFLNNQMADKILEKNPNAVIFYAVSSLPYTVIYEASQQLDLPKYVRIKGIGKINLVSKEEIKKKDPGFYSQIVAISERTTANRGKNFVGVVNRLLKTVARLLEDPKKPLKGKTIALIFTTQAILKRAHYGDTFEHIKTFLTGDKNFQRLNPFWERKLKSLYRARFLSNDIKNIVFVIDEITGSETGRFLFKHFLNSYWFDELKKFLKREFDLNLLFALLDASLKGKEVFKAFATDDDIRPIVYLAEGKKEEYAEAILNIQVKVKRGPYSHTFQCLDAVGFPAAELDFIYDFLPIYEADFKKQRKQLTDELLKILQNRLKTKEQILVFIQDKEILEEIEKRVLTSQLLKEEEVLTIHSLTKEDENRNLKKVRLILATSSASRGITFPLVDSYIVVLPFFETESNLAEIVQTLYRGRSSLETPEGKKISKEDGKREIYLLAPIYCSNKYDYFRRLAEALEMAILLKASLLTVSSGNFVIQTKGEEKVLKIVPVGIQRDKVFHPFKEFERIYISSVSCLRQLIKIESPARGYAYQLLKILNEEFLNWVKSFLPPQALELILGYLNELDYTSTVEDFLRLTHPWEEHIKPLTVKGHNIIFSTYLVRTAFSSKRDKEMLNRVLFLIKKILSLDPNNGVPLKALEEFLMKQREEHIDISPEAVERVLIVPPLGWNYENMAISDKLYSLCRENKSLTNLLGSLIYSFLGTKGNFYPQRCHKQEYPFGITDLPSHLFEEVEKEFLKEGNLFLSSEINLLELMV